MNPPGLLLESIRLINGRMPFLKWHLHRIEKTCRQLWAREPSFSLSKALKESIQNTTQGLFKIRVLYHEQGIQTVEVLPYTPRPIRHLQLVEASELEYAFKFSDRGQLLHLQAQKGQADDILMCRNGLITDTSYANIVFWDGQHWFTPAKPLLEGTQRARLIEKGKIKPLNIRIDELANFQTAKLINAMMQWKESPEIPVSQIFGHQ